MAGVQLYLIRHGIAAERGEAYPDDTVRPLTAEGISRMRKQAKALNGLGVQLDVIVSSPLVRTRQTADIVSDALEGTPDVVLSDALAPEGTSAAVIQELARHTKKHAVALVGHEPNLGELAARLIGARRALEFKKGGVCRIDFEAFPPKGAGSLRFFLPPRLLRQLG
jgi:phosphohistidine phosphatase